MDYLLQSDTFLQVVIGNPGEARIVFDCPQCKKVCVRACLQQNPHLIHLSTLQKETVDDNGNKTGQFMSALGHTSDRPVVAFICFSSVIVV